MTLLALIRTAMPTGVREQDQSQSAALFLLWQTCPCLAVRGTVLRFLLAPLAHSRYVIKSRRVSCVSKKQNEEDSINTVPRYLLQGNFKFPRQIRLTEYT